MGAAIASFWLTYYTYPTPLVTAIAHKFSTGDVISTLGVTGCSEINGSNQSITVIDNNHYIINGVALVNTYTGGGKSFK